MASKYGQKWFGKLMQRRRKDMVPKQEDFYRLIWPDKPKSEHGAQSWVSQIERGLRWPDKPALIRIIEYLNLYPDLTEMQAGIVVSRAVEEMIPKFQPLIDLASTCAAAGQWPQFFEAMRTLCDEVNKAEENYKAAKNHA